MSATSRPSKIVPHGGFSSDPEPTAEPKRKVRAVKSKPAARRNGTAAGKRHMARVSAMPCILCELLGTKQEGKTDVHHIREEAGAGQRNSDFLTIPACHEACHQGPQGIHGDKSRLRLAGVTELDLLAMVVERLVEAA